MKNSILILSFLISLSCSNKVEENKPAEDQPYTLASRSYCEKAEASLKAWANADFDTWVSFFAEDILIHNPRGPMESPFLVDETSSKEQAQWFKDWFKKREISDIKFLKTSSIAIEAKEDLQYYGNSGISVLTTTNMQMSIYGKPMIMGMSVIHHFNKDGKIDKLYYLYDQENQYDAMNY